jgi:hypothetical protein
MKLGEALNERARLSKKVTETRDLWSSVLVTNEGEEPALDPQGLLDDALKTINEIGLLAARINNTNSLTLLETGETITEAIARRDVLGARAAFLDFGIRKLAGVDGGHFRYRDEPTTVKNLEVASLIAERDKTAADRRSLDAQLQALNWTTELSE